jgi:hypothetical protein
VRRSARTGAPRDPGLEGRRAAVRTAGDQRNGGIGPPKEVIMKCTIKAVLAPLALAALGAVALAAYLSGEVHGRWTAVDPTTTVLNGIAESIDGVPMYRLEARLAGGDAGTVQGVLRNLPPKPGLVPQPLLRVSGTFQGLADGGKVVTAQILRQDSDSGDWVVVGSLVGMLHPNPPKYPPGTGHFHGRWEFK